MAHINVLLGTYEREVPQSMVLGTTMDRDARVVGLDIGETSTMALLARQEGGKSYTAGVLIESFSNAIPGITKLAVPGFACVIHYSRSPDYRPEWTTLVEPNTDEAAVASLRQLGGEPVGAKDVILVTPPQLVEERRREYPDLDVYPLTFGSSELTVSSYLNLMGDESSSSLEQQVLLQLMSEMRSDLSPARLLERIADHEWLTQEQKYLLNLKVSLAAGYIADDAHFASLVKSGRTMILDLRDEFLDRNTAFRLALCAFQCMERITTTEDGRRLPKLMVFDEAHQYANDPFLVSAMVEAVRLMRHKGMSLIFASQDPESLDPKILELCSIMLVLPLESPQSVKTIVRYKGQLGNVPADSFMELKSGEAYIWSRKASDPIFSHTPIRVKIRPRATLHGGNTKKVE
ncbi:MAG: hypothetical protein PF961_16600 [Planctomycetota bacterium]|jgi:DNA phosphorothioation-dependent restriction protein DptH|nr:hypothetical protein [Planctomycetota bacterium]